MGIKETIRLAAVTARVLGYTLERSTNSGLIHEYTRSDFYLVVRCPKGTRVSAWYSSAGLGRGMDLDLSDSGLLGHHIVRLHMESNYGIKTEHYWEG